MRAFRRSSSSAHPAQRLQFIWLEDHAQTTTAIQIWYRGGSKDDPLGRSGFRPSLRTHHVQSNAAGPKRWTG